MNKKLIAQLLGGGLAISLASVIGLKINDNINHNKKLGRYKKINQDYSSNLEEQFKGQYYLPSWDDSPMWKRMHGLLKINFSSGNPYDKWPTAESFRDYCYENAEKDTKNSDCNGTWGWCVDCIRDKSFDKK